MKYLKTYENLNKPQLGDYVTCLNKYDDRDFFKQNIGKIVDINVENHDGEEMTFYKVYFENTIPRDIIVDYGSTFASTQKEDNLNDHILNLNGFEIDHFAKTKEDLEIKTDANKFNL